MAIQTSADLRALYPDKFHYLPDLVPTALINDSRVVTFGADIMGDAPSLLVPWTAEDATTDFVNEGAEIPLSDPEFNQLEIRTRKLAVLTEASRESTRNTPGSVDMLVTSQLRSLTVKLNAVLLNNLPAQGSTGLVLDAAPIGGTVTTNLDPIADAVTGVEVNGGTPTAILIDPIGAGILRKLKTTSASAETLLQVDAGSREIAFYGVPVIVCPQMPARTGLVVDSSDIIAAYSNVEVDKSEEAAFSRDSVQYRTTVRTGWKKVHPQRATKFVFAAPAA
ncbi:phage major capsid protein [Clavibacter zhangzhiyongii]|uniref:phage major capsid protein n=1 Tax=Clavibacter zhangzhiyongii TaxID=2768071 RepID=UPI0039DF847B